MTLSYTDQFEHEKILYEKKVCSIDKIEKTVLNDNTDFILSAWEKKLKSKALLLVKMCSTVLYSFVLFIM
jgi:hypothetical protein